MKFSTGTKKILQFFIPVLLLVIYFPFLNAPFFRDDNGWIVATYAENYIKHSLTSGDHSGYPYFRPVSRILFYFLHYFAGNNPFFYHLISLTLHCVCCILLFLFLCEFIPKRVDRYFCCLAFYIFPGFNDAVFWVSNLSDLLVAVLILSMLLINKKLVRGISCVLLIWFICFFAFFTKENALVLPLILLIFDFKGREGGGLRILDGWLKYSGLFIIFIFALFIHLQITFAAPSSTSINFDLFSVIQNLIKYFQYSSFPFFIYGGMGTSNIHIFRILFPVFLIFPLVCIFLIKKDLFILKFFLSYIVLLLPYAATKHFSLRYLYTASLFFIPLFFEVLEYYSQVFSRRNVRGLFYTIASIVLIAYIFQTVNNQLLFRQRAVKDMENPPGVAFNKILITIEGADGSQELMRFRQGSELFISDFVGINGEARDFYNVLEDPEQNKPVFYIHRKGSFDVCWLVKEGVITLFLQDLILKGKSVINLELFVINILEEREHQRFLKIELNDLSVKEKIVKMGKSTLKSEFSIKEALRIDIGFLMDND